ncbi:nucleoside/nucleotide kinase family protein [Thioalkalivibrio thiocyanodenitrificans]|uniref:hypothetical protein n=1 Tax=Thioalkalivibrio thiocyanodenitrificans TaxID=243063 RepID=UPI000364BAF5|nr:hypothetical protein [Thioalkalivibrio thiocyanodenitrificans]
MKGRIIGMLGKRGHGKDTVADHLCEVYGFKRMAFADALREEVAEHFGVPVELLLDRDRKETPCKELAPPAPWDVGFRGFMRRILAPLGFLKRSPREVLQHWGTEYRRLGPEGDPEYWTKKLVGKVRSSGDGDYIITDVRFPNEADLFMDQFPELGLEVHTVRVVRPALLNQNKSRADEHPSETALDDFSTDITLTNREGEIAALYREAEQALNLESTLKLGLVG